MNSEYIFVSYAHKDKKAVLKEISKREKAGQQFWYDKSIDAGADWAETIGKNLEGAESVLYFESGHSRKSENCQRELAFAKDHSIPVETVRLKSKLLYIVIAAVIVIAVAAVLILKSFIGNIPDVIGDEALSGKSAIEESGFECNTAYGYSDEYPLGYVMSQSKTGNSLNFVPVTITQSLGTEANLVMMPDTVNSYISDGIAMLVDCGLTKFTVIAGSLDNNDFGYITKQSAPAGYKISKENVIELTVAKDDNPLQFEYNGYLFTIDDETVFDLSDPDKYGITADELKLFEENSHHTIWNPDDFENIWLPSQNETVITENPDSCYGWVIVRDTELDAENLFKGYSEIYVCPGITVTITGKVSEYDGQYTDYYVAKGGTLIFEDEVDGGLYLVNDGTTLFKKNVSGGTGGALIANRGTVVVSGTVNEGVNVWSFYQSSFTGTDNTQGTIHDYSPYIQVDASNWYEGCSGSDGIGAILDKLETFATYDQRKVGRSVNNTITIVPVIKPEDYSDHCNEDGYASNYLFLSDCTVDDGTHTGWGFIVAPEVTLTVNKTDILASIFAEKGSTVIINGDLPAYFPYSDYMVNDGTIIINGNMNHNGLKDNYLLMNRGSLTVNGSWGGAKVYAYNFPGSSFNVENLLDGTYVANVDFTPDYIIYGHADSGSAIQYVDDVLAKKYGYPGWHMN